MDELAIDTLKYGQLLAAAIPGIIETSEEHERLLTLAEGLMDKGDQLTPEERKLLELVVVLVELFERVVEDADGDDAEEAPLPHETLQRLMQARGWGPEALNDIFGNPHFANEALAGRRSITRGQAKGLGNLFRMPAKLFLPD